MIAGVARPDPTEPFGKSESGVSSRLRSSESPKFRSGADPYRVVRIIARLNVGGPAIHVVNLSAGLDDRYRTLLVAGDVDATEADMSDHAWALGVDLLRMPELGRTIRPWQDLVALVKLVRLLRRLRPQIVHTHTAKAGVLGRLAAVLAGVPIRVHTYHGHVLRGYFSPRMTRWVIRAERFMARLTTRIVTISELQAAEIVNEFAVAPADRVSVVPLGFDLGRFERDRLDTLRGTFRRELGTGDRPIVTVVGRLVPIKNHALLFEAVARVARVDPSFVLAVVGGGPEESALRRLAKDLDIEERVRFLGWRRDIDAIYADSDVVALSSTNEGTPVCLIEALACGCAVVATDVGGVRDVLEGGRLGRLVDAADVDGFARELASLLADDRSRSAIGELGSASIFRRYGVQRLLADVSKLYDELLGRGARTERPSV